MLRAGEVKVKVKGRSAHSKMEVISASASQSHDAARRLVPAAAVGVAKRAHVLRRSAWHIGVFS